MCIKAMRLPEIFRLSTFPVFRTFWTFGLRNKSGILTLVSNVRKFCETYRKFSRNSSSKPLFENIPEFLDYVEIGKNDRNFWTFSNISKVRNHCPSI